MRKKKSFRGYYAVSQVIGFTILVGIAAFSVFFIRPFLSPDLDTIDKSLDLIGYVTHQGRAVLKHIGGVSISNYEVLVYNINGTPISSKYYRDIWKIGECRYFLEDINYPPLLSESEKVEIYILINREDGSQYQIFNGVLSGPPGPESSTNPVLISSLRTDSPDEDLICYSYPLKPNINATTYIYNWKLNGIPLLDINMPFDTENNISCRDYSGNDNNGTLVDVIWNPNGIVGGCLYFDGSSEYITMNLPDIFNDLKNNSFTISLWLLSKDITADNAIILMAEYDNYNFIKMFLQGNEVHAGVCIEGIKEAVRTENLSSDTWYHILFVWDASEDSLYIYCNGQQFTEVGYRQFAMGGISGLLEIGHGTASSKFWKGYMDEFEIYKCALTSDQAYQIYLQTKDGDYDKRIMVSEETSVGDLWQCIVTPNDGIQDDIPVFSNILKIKNYPGGI